MAKEKAEPAQKVRRPTALKRDMQSAKRRLHNRAFLSRVGTALRSLEKTPEKEKLDLVYSLVDKGVKTGIFKKNKANRLKSRLTRRLAK